MGARQLPWQDLQYFLATARSGTVSAAAETLGVNASTVIRRLVQLERHLATRLFNRSPRGYALTPAGAELFDHVLAVEAELLAAERQISHRDQNLSGAIRVATVDDLAFTVLAPIVRDFRQQHPKVTLEFFVHSDLADLGRREADVAIRTGARPVSADVIPRRVCDIAVALYASRLYLEQHGRATSLQDLAAHGIVRGDAGRDRLPMERFIEQHAPGSAAFRSNSMLARFAAVRDGLGLGFLPCFIADGDEAVVRLDVVRQELSAGLWIVVHADLRRIVRVRAFVDFAHAALLNVRPRLEGATAQQAGPIAALR